MDAEDRFHKRVLELLEQYPELTQSQAYTQAVTEMSEAIIAEAMEKVKDGHDR